MGLLVVKLITDKLNYYRKYELNSISSKMHDTTSHCRILPFSYITYIQSYESLPSIYCGILASKGYGRTLGRTKAFELKRQLFWLHVPICHAIMSSGSESGSSLKLQKVLYQPVVVQVLMLVSTQPYTRQITLPTLMEIFGCTSHGLICNFVICVKIQRKNTRVHKLKVKLIVCMVSMALRATNKLLYASPIVHLMSVILS